MSSGLSASTIKSWFQYRCERKTRYEVMDDEERAAVPVLKEEREALWAQLGNEFEARVVAALARRHAVLRPGHKEKVLSERRAIAFLKGELTETYAAQVNLRPMTPPALLANTSLEPRRTFADLIRVNRSGPLPVFQIIDVKATRKATAFHKTQVAFYARMLEAVLRDLRVAGTIHSEGEIWRIPDDGSAQGSDYKCEPFELAPYLRMVDDFCAIHLPRIADTVVIAGRDDTFFHLYFKCEQCAYLPHCERVVAADRPPSHRDVSAVAGLTHEAKRALLRLGITSVDSLAKAKGVARASGIGWLLQRRAETLRVRAQALAENQILRAPDEHTFLMPPRVDAALFLVVDHDPVDNTLVTLGYTFIRDGVEQRRVEVLPTSDRGAEADALCAVFEKLLLDLTALDAHNRARADEDAPGLRAHIFFYEPAEVTYLHQAIARHLDDPRIRSGLLNMVRLFPPEEVVPEPEFRGAHHLPATAVRNVVEQLYAVPATVAYDLRQVSGALAAAGRITRAYEPASAFQRPFSSLLSIDVMRGLREGRSPPETLVAVRADVEQRLDATRAVVEWLFTEDEAAVRAGAPRLLRLNKKPFQFHESFDPLDAEDLDILQALEILENRAGMLDALVALAQPANRRRDAGRCIAGMTLRNLREPKSFGPRQEAYLNFEVPLESQASDLKAGDFDLILTDDDPDLRLDPSAWKSCSVRLLPRQPGRPERFLTLAMARSAFEGDAFQRMLARAGDRPVWHVDRFFNDVNTPRAAAFIKSLMK